MAAPTYKRTVVYVRKDRTRPFQPAPFDTCLLDYFGMNDDFGRVECRIRSNIVYLQPPVSAPPSTREGDGGGGGHEREHGGTAESGTSGESKGGNTGDESSSSERNTGDGGTSDTNSRKGDKKAFRFQHPNFCVGHKITEEQREELPTEVRERGVDVGVCILLETSDGRILVTRRAPHMRTFPGVWVPPGGHVEEGENLVDAGCREMMEETGLELKNLMKMRKMRCGKKRDEEGKEEDEGRELKNEEESKTKVGNENKEDGKAVDDDNEDANWWDLTEGTKKREGDGESGLNLYNRQQHMNRDNNSLYRKIMTGSTTATSNTNHHHHHQKNQKCRASTGAETSDSRRTHATNTSSSSNNNSSSFNYDYNQQHYEMIVTGQDIGAKCRILGLWESFYPPVLYCGLPKRHHLVVYLHLKLKLTSADLQQFIQLDFNEVDACLWLTRELAEVVVYGYRYSSIHLYTPCPSLDLLEVPITLVDDEGFHIPALLDPKALRKKMPDPDREVERVSTGTRFALKLWLQDLAAKEENKAKSTQTLKTSGSQARVSAVKSQTRQLQCRDSFRIRQVQQGQLRGHLRGNVTNGHLPMGGQVRDSHQLRSTQTREGEVIRLQTNASSSVQIPMDSQQCRDNDFLFS